MSQSKEDEIRLSFLEEATEHIYKIEFIVCGVAGTHIKEEQICTVLRAAHSIKGSAAMVGFQTLSDLACHLEDFFKAFKTQPQQFMQPELEGVLLAVTDQMRQVIALNLKGEFVEQGRIEDLTPLFEKLYQFKSDSIPESNENTALMLEDDQNMVKIIFETEVEGSLEQLEAVFFNPQQDILLDKWSSVLEELTGLGEMLQIMAFSHLCKSILYEIKNNPKDIEKIAQISLVFLRKAQIAVLEGKIDAIPLQVELSNLSELELNDSPLDGLHIDLASSLEQIPETSFDVLELQNELSQVYLNNRYNSDFKHTEFEEVDFSRLLEPKLDINLPEYNKINEDVFYISSSQINQITELFENIKLNSEQLKNLVKVIKQQNNSENIFQSPIQLNDEVPILFDDEIEEENRRLIIHKPSKKPTILVIDDSKAVRDFLEEVLLNACYQVELAENGQVAIDKLERELDISAVICDLEMPVVGGYGFLSRIKSDNALKHLPVAMLTSRTEESSRELAMRLGASAYFTKPCSKRDLLKTLEELVSSSTT